MPAVYKTFDKSQHCPDTYNNKYDDINRCHASLYLQGYDQKYSSVSALPYLLYKLQPQATPTTQISLSLAV